MKFKFKQFFCLVILIGFIAIVTAEPYTTYKSADIIGNSLIDLMDVELIYEKDDNDFKDEFSFSVSEYDSVIYFACDEIMSVQELLIVKLFDTDDAESLVAEIEDRIEEKISLFENYADTQADLLKNAIVETNNYFVFYAVGADAHDCYDQFKILINS